MKLRAPAVALVLSLFLTFTCFYVVSFQKDSPQPEVPLPSLPVEAPKRKLQCSDYEQRAAKVPDEFDSYYAKQAEKWLDAYVVPGANLIFCQVHKVGSTKWLRLLRWLDGQDYNQFPHLWWGDRPANLSTLRHYGKPRALEMMFDPNWTKIVAVRDPLDRLRSAYFSKVNRSRPLPNVSAQVFADVLKVPLARLRSLSFEEFLVRVENGMREHNMADLHWRKQSTACSLGHFKKCYQHTFFMDRDKSTHDALGDCVLQVMLSKMSESDRRNLKSLNVTAETKTDEQEHMTQSADVYDYQRCVKALELYAEDYHVFSIPRPTCHKDPPHVRWP